MEETVVSEAHMIKSNAYGKPRRFTLVLAHLRGITFIMWHAKHMFVHVLLGLAWAWMLREFWNEFNLKYVILAITGSLIPDSEHLIYFFTYGRKDPYSLAVKKLLREHEWRTVTVFVEKGHKRNTSLKFHNMIIMFLLMMFTSVSLLFDWKSWVVLLGAMITHYIFDIIDDFANLGYLNSNWRRWGRFKI